MIRQPRGINIGVAAGLGAAASFIFGTVTLSDALFAFSNIWDAALAFIGIVILSSTLDALGFFKWSALRVAELAGGGGLKLYLYISILTALVSFLFSNDSAILILTPLVLELVNHLEFDDGERLAYLFIAGFISQVASMLLITSNPINIISADFFGYTFVEHLIFMGPITIVILLINFMIIYLYFGRSISASYSLDKVDSLIAESPDIRHPHLRASIVTLAAIDVGYILASLKRIRVSFVICSGASLLLLFYVISSRRGTIPEGERQGVTDILRRVNWDILVFMIGMFLVVQGLNKAGAINLYASLFAEGVELPYQFSALAPSLMVTGSSGVMNNWPMIFLGILSIRRAVVTYGLDPLAYTTLIFGNIIGNILGPLLFPLGSLAMLLWMSLIKRRGMKIGLIDYVKIGSILSISEVVVASILLWFEQNYLHLVINIE
jgi:arsenical pump membrane protein